MTVKGKGHEDPVDCLRQNLVGDPPFECQDLPTLMECFNHSTQKQTLAYLCVQPEEIKNVYENEL